MAKLNFPPGDKQGGVGIVIHGLEEVKTKLDNAESGVIPAVAKELHKQGEKVIGDSKKNYVPVATGTLKNTGHVKLPKFKTDGVIISLGYGGPAAPYALDVHENPRAGKTEGISPQGYPYPTTMGGKPTWATVGEWKYLEKPVKKHSDNIERKLFSKVDNLIKKG